MANPRTKLERLLAAGLTSKGQIWELMSRNVDASATINEAGQFVIDGKRFSSPSSAATHATGHQINGWTTWRLLGSSVTLDELRKQLQNTSQEPVADSKSSRGL